MPRKRRHRLVASPSPRIWAQVVQEIGRSAAEAVQDMENVVRSIVDIIDRLLAFGTDVQTYMLGGVTLFDRIDLRELASSPAIGVDSSMSRSVRVGHRYYAIVDSALVAFRRLGDRNPDEKIWAGLATAPDDAEPSYAKVEINLRMFEMELEAIKEASRIVGDRYYGAIVFLDGPLIDPPSEPADEGLRGAYRSYLEERAEAIRGIVEAGGTPVGVVKRVRGSLVASAVAEKLEEEGLRFYAETLRSRRVGDYSLAMYTSLALASQGSRHPITLVLRPVRLSTDIVPAVEVFEERGLRVYTFLMVPRVPGVGLEPRPLRVEVVSRGGSVDQIVAEAAAAVVLWLVPGTNIPWPVLLAHMRCTIRDRDSRRLLRELITRSIYRAAANFTIGSPELIATIM